MNVPSETTDNPYEPPVQPALVVPRSLTVFEWIGVAFLSIFAASIAFVGTCGGMGFIGFTMSYPRGNSFGEFLMIAGWIVGGFVAMAVAFAVGRLVRGKFLRESDAENGRK